MTRLPTERMGADPYVLLHVRVGEQRSGVEQDWQKERPQHRLRAGFVPSDRRSDSVMGDT